MISHIVLFRPRPDVADEERRAFIHALEVACREVPSVRRATIGRSLGDDSGREYPYTAVMEFDDASGLRAYLAHPLHQPLARLFHQTCAATLIVNAETKEPGAPGGSLDDFLRGGSDADRG